MTLRFEQIIHDIERMSTVVNASDRRLWLQQARQLLRSHDRARLVEKLGQNREARLALLASQPLGELDERIPAPRAPHDYTVVAADGSNIAPDRDSPFRYYLLNTGLVRLCYGDSPTASIESEARLFYRSEDLYWDDKRQRPVDGNRLALLMRVEEIVALPKLVDQTSDACVAVVDGQLIMWGLQNEHHSDKDRLLGAILDAFEQLRERRVPVVGYISNTESFELVSALKIYLCPTSPGSCRQCHARGPAEVQLCYHLNDFRDPALLFDFLEAGERSCLFASHAEILEDYPGEHKIAYFYMSTGDEIARVEMPRWVAEDDELLNRAHAVLHDQNRRSGQQPPYPPVLHEAHEAAVVSNGDREGVRLLIEEQLQRSGSFGLGSAKAYHKRVRGV
jgi:hypothetical protein